MALWLSCELASRQISGPALETSTNFCVGVVCHTTQMMKQWQERIQQYVPNARIGLVQQDQCLIADRDIIIISVKTVANREFSKHAFENIAMMIWDEIHLMCTRTFSRAFPKLATKYSLGLSATPYRKDGCDFIFQSFIGPVVYMSKRGRDESIEARCVTFLMDNIEVTYNRFHKVQYTPTTVAVINRPERTAWLAQLVANLGSEGRCVLVLGEYVGHLKALQKAIDELRPEKTPTASQCYALMMGAHPRLGAKSPLRVLPKELLRRIALCMRAPVTCGLYIGEMKNEQRKHSEERDIILGTYKLASVGMDIPSLNCLVFASPRKDIEQSVGRILRKQHGDGFRPLIIDVVDNHTLYQAQARERKKFYRHYGYTLIYQQVNQDGSIKSTRQMSGKKQNNKKKSTKDDDDDEDDDETPVRGNEECMFEGS
jgi:superfamily II DNA or RNA helicase